VDRLPPGVTMGATKTPAEPTPRKQDARGAIVVVFTAASDAPLTERTVNVVLSAGGLFADTKLTWLSIEQPKDVPVIELELDRRLNRHIVIRAGKTTTASVQLQRRDYNGPIQVKVVGLPSGVTVEPVAVANRQDWATLRF